MAPATYRIYCQLRVMKWLSNRYAYPLVILVIIVSVALQLAWLSQLFRAQQVQVKHDLEQIVGKSAEMSSYLSMVPGRGNSQNFKNFFLSQEWLQFKQALNDMRTQHIGSRFNSEIKGDSTFIDIGLRIPNGIPVPKHGHVVRYDPGLTMEQILAFDKADLKRMDSIVTRELAGIDVAIEKNYTVYAFEDKRILQGASAETVKKAAFVSQQYSYDLQFYGMYQLIVPSINHLVIYRMRYYLASSIFMLILTIAVFIFILRLMRNQRIYAQARVAFTSNMTHELKTPVATVSLALETIMENKMENDPQTLKTYLEISRGELRRLNLMIDKVLNLEQMDNGQTRLRTELFDVQQGLQQVIASMRLQVENTGAIVNFKAADKPCFVSGDPVHLTNIFYNLVENALKYGGSKVKLDISCTGNSSEVKVSFKDNGPGIAPEYRERIFERFFRVPAVTNDVHNVKGTGLGLNYVKQIVEKHGGHIKLDSEIGKGSNFTLYFPAAI